MGNCVSLQISCDKALNNACSSLFGVGNCMLMMEENLEALENAMQELAERRDGVLRRVVTEEDEGLQRLAQVQGWLSLVEGVESQVNDLLEARSTQTKSLCLCGHCSLNFISGCNYGRKVLKKLNQVEGLLSNGVFEAVTEKIPARKVEKKHIPITVGLDRRVRRAWNRLMEDGPRTLGLYGVGGLGKTTVLACINNKFLEMVNEFDLVIWVLVSKDLQYEGIQDQILRRLGLDKEWEQETEEERAYEIYNILDGKKFVLLLDDLWSKVDLNKVGVPPLTQQSGSKIVFTTRSEKVCKDMEANDVMEVDRLSPDESWELFQKRLGKFTIRFHPDIALARTVAGQCYGLPLALNVIGQSMTRKMAVQEWRHAIVALVSSNNEFPLRTEEKILPLLKVGYDRLEDEKVKLCFLYCCLFPEDYEIEKNELIEYWVCEGFIDGRIDEDGANKEGHKIIDLLVSAHLLMNDGVTTKVKMHDVVREVALWIATDFGKQKKLLNVKSGVWLHKIPKDISSEVVRSISLMNNQIAEISCSPHCSKLSTLLLQNNKLVEISGEFFRFMPALVVLDLSENKSLIRLPEEISNLGSLQYLNLSHTRIKSLPVGMKKLRKLIVLNLDFTLELESIVGIATTFPNLQVLKFFNSGVCIDGKLMEELQLLEHLKLLKATIEDAVILESIQGIVRLANSIQSLCLRNMSAPVVMLNTVALAGLRILAMVKCKVSEIKIDWKSKDTVPSTRSPSFKQLTGIHISNLEGPKDLSWLAYAQNLRFLYVMGSSSIEEIINREKEKSISNAHPGIVALFAKLESLKVSELDELKEIWPNPRALPNLRHVIVRACPKLPLSLRDMRWYNGEKE